MNRSINLKAFRQANDLRQSDLAELIGVSRSFIARIERGLANLPEHRLQTLLENTDLDSSMLMTEPAESIPTNAEVEKLRIEVELLRARLMDAEAEREKLWELIHKLTTVQYEK